MRQKSETVKNKNGNRLHFDFQGLKFKFWCYFAFFAILLLGMLWFLQIFFLQTYYEDMKTREISRVASNIASDFKSTSTVEDLNTFLSHLQDISARNDLYCVIRTDSGIRITPSDDNLLYPRHYALGYGSDQDVDTVVRQLQHSPTGTVSYTKPTNIANMKTLVYGKVLKLSNDNVYFCLFTPLSPVQSTVGILANQLIYVTVISLLLAFALSFFISSRLTKPIFHITRNAARLAKGDYSVTFDGGHYSEIVELADTLNYTSKELSKSDDLRKDLIANVSHDLRTPLTMVKSYAEMIRDISGDNPEKRRDHLQVIIDEADRLNKLVSDLLVLSKMQSGVEALNPTEFNMKDMVEGMLQLYLLLAEQQGYQLTLQCPEDFFVYGDESRLKQVVANLVTNAIKHSGEGRSITVSLEETVLPEEEAPAKGNPKKNKKQREHTKPVRSVRCSVSDTGPGILPDELEHIWERYYKASSNNARSQSGGSGLGLAIVREILLLHRASFGVESQVDQGSTFWFELPLITLAPVDEPPRLAEDSAVDSVLGKEKA